MTYVDILRFSEADISVKERQSCTLNVKFANQRWDVLKVDETNKVLVIIRDDGGVVGTRIETVGFSACTDLMLSHREGCTHPIFQRLKAALS